MTVMEKICGKMISVKLTRSRCVTGASTEQKSVYVCENMLLHTITVFSNTNRANVVAPVVTVIVFVLAVSL